jgi:putative tryptophan/tyrosine transport system substrate-binding protein
METSLLLRKFGRVGVPFFAVVGFCLIAFGGVGSSRQQHNFKVAYFGSSTVERDTRFARFRRALDRIDPLRIWPMEFDYANIAGLPDEQAAQDMAVVLTRRPEVVVTPTATGALIALRLPRSASIVFSSLVDPVQTGVVRALQSPGQKITGVSLYDDLDSKRFELLRDAFPGVRRVGVLVDPAWPHYERFHDTIGLPAAAVGLTAIPFVANTVAELNAAMLSPAAYNVDAWYVPQNYIAYLAQKQIIEHIRRLKVPSIHASEQEVANGALMAYVQDSSFVYDAIADLTLRILRGEDAGSIPIQRPKKFILAVRPRDEPGTPQISPSIIRRADKVY